MELVVYTAVRIWVNMHEYFVVWRGKRRVLRQKLRGSESYAQWQVAAKDLDAHMKKDAWKRQDDCPYYDYRLIRRITRLLAAYRSVSSREYARGVD
jgi:hypothetical protein